MISFRNTVKKRQFQKDKNSDKTIYIVEKILDFNKQQKGKGLKLFTSKEMLQRLSIALAQTKSGNTSENLLNGIHQIIYSFYRAHRTTKNVYNSIMNSIKLQYKMDTR